MTTTLVGTLEFASKYRYGLTSRGAPLYLFTPYDETWQPLIVGSTERDTTRNQIAIVEAPQTAQGVPDHPMLQKSRGNLIRLLGPVGDKIAEISGLLQHYCPDKQTRIFTEADTTHDSQRLEISASSGWTVFHVDPPGCRDIDDAIAFHPDGRMAITIADAAAVVPLNSIVDDTARAIGATFYDLDGRVVKPMLPPTISEETASLLPGERRRGVSLILNANGSLDRWTLSWITVAESYTYDNFMTSKTAAALQILPTIDPHDWIADQMIRYNTEAATLLRVAGQGLLRVQEVADADAISSWISIDPVLSRLAHESASYEQVDLSRSQGHASLALDAYCHASSPIRRYADLANQRILKGLIAGTPISTLDITTATHLNARTKANRRWTRDLTFLHHVTPGRVHEIDVIWTSADQVWVPTWGRLLRLRHDEIHPAGTHGCIQIFCDPTRRNWRRRILTAPVVEV
jgi:exoribonuclease R